MPVTEPVARLWGQLTGEKVWEAVDPLSQKAAPVKHWYRGPWRAVLIPDPSQKPWAWIPLLTDDGWSVTITGRFHDITAPSYSALRHRSAELDNQHGFGDTPELALAAAVAKMAEDVK